MNNKNEDNGRQPPLPGQPPPLLDNEANNENGASNEKMEICRNFVWGTCNKNTQCKFKHELNFEEMKKILKFCHDYQNLPGCTREHCTYLHTTKEEESLFFAKGKLPRVLAERHANMSDAVAETIPQIALFIQESFVGPTPPPPPPPAPVAAPPPVAPVVHPTPRPVPPMLPLQLLPPPPPPPTTAPTAVQQIAPIFTAPTAQITPVYPMTQPPPPIPIFDASRPPPPIPTHVQAKKSSVKRQSPNSFDVQPKKVRKVDEAKVADALCDQCMQRDIRVESYRQEMDKLCSEEEYHTLIYKKKLEEYQNRKELLRSLVSNELFRLIEEYVEGLPQLHVHDVLSQLNQTSFVSGTSNVPKHFLLQLIEYVLENSRVDAIPSSTLRLDDSLRQSLSRRTNSVSLSSPDVLQTFMEILRQSNASDRVQSSDLPGNMTKNSTITNNNSMNGLHRFSNGQKAESQASRMPPAPLAAPPPPPYQHYAVPPARLYYPPPFPVPPTAGAVATSQLTRAPPPPAAVPATAPPPAPPAQTCHPYVATRYPPPYYQRHQ